MKKNSDKFLVLIVSIIILTALVWFPINHLLLHFGIRELQTTDNWQYYKKSQDGIIGKIDDFFKANKVNLENRVTNYFPFYKKINSSYYDFVISTNKLLYKNDIPIGANTSNEYVYYSEDQGFYYLRNNHSLDDLTDRVNKQVNFFNELYESNKNINLNIYLIPRLEQSTLIDDNLSSYTMYFKNNINKNINVSELSYDSLDDYVSKFYRTDHHWNIYGAYTGYKNIMNMLKKPSFDLDFKKVNNKPYYGSLAKSSLSTLTFDDVYDFDYLNNLNVTVNGGVAPDKFKPRDMNYKQKYEFFDQYIHYFDGQYGLVKYTNNNDNVDNLLIFSDSYAWQIDYLIANEYKNTYVVNLRFDEYANGKFDYNKFIKENNISDVLFLYEGSATIFDQYDYGFSDKIVR